MGPAIQAFGFGLERAASRPRRCAPRSGFAVSSPHPRAGFLIDSSVTAVCWREEILHHTSQEMERASSLFSWETRRAIAPTMSNFLTVTVARPLGRVHTGGERFFGVNGDVTSFDRVTQ